MAKIKTISLFLKINPVNLKMLDDEVIRLVIGHIHDMSDEEFDKIINN